MAKFVYFFGNGKAEGRGDMKDVLGGKGAGLAEMTNIGLPVPAGFTISVDACVAYDKLGQKMPKGLDKEVLAHLARSTKGFVNSEYDRFLARMPIAMSIVKLGYTQDMIEAEPFLIRPMMLDVTEPSDRDILQYYQHLIM